MNNMSKKFNSILGNQITGKVDFPVGGQLQGVDQEIWLGLIKPLYFLGIFKGQYQMK